MSQSSYYIIMNANNTLGTIRIEIIIGGKQLKKKKNYNNDNNLRCRIT